MRDKGTIFYEPPKVTIKTYLLIGAGLATTFIVLIAAIAIGSSQQQPIIPPVSHNINGGTYEINMSKATSTPTPTLTPVMSNLEVSNDTGDYPDAHGQYLYDPYNNTYDIVNTTATPTPIPANIEEARRLGWTPDLGDVDEYIYKYNLARGYLKLQPKLSLEILGPDKQPWNWYQETVAPGQVIAGYYKINNLADYPYQGDIDVYVNASLYYNGGLVHIENKIVSTFVSITPKHCNMPEEPIYWMVPKEISTGVYEIVIELREKEYGKTIASYRMTPTVAYVDGSGYKYF